MSPGPLISTDGETRGAKGALCWIVPRNMHIQVPAGFAYAAPLLRFPLTPDSPAAVRSVLWGRHLALSIRAVVLVSSVPVRVHIDGSAWPDSSHLPPRQQREWSVDKSTVLSMAPAQQRWPGEVFAVPLKVIDIEAAGKTHLGTFLRLQIEQRGAGQ